MSIMANIRELFGGSMRAFVPSEAKDVSVFREVPDNQEVFCHPVTDQSIMVDILEYQSHVQNEDAAKYHFEDLASCNESFESFEISTVEAIPMEKLSMKQCSNAWRLRGKQFVSKFNEGENAKNIIEVCLALFRLPQYTTDILVVFNNPTVVSPASSSSSNTNTSTQDSSLPWTEESFYFLVTSLSLENAELLNG